MGPDWNRILAIKRLSAERLVYAAGGVHDADDLAALARIGIAGALVASCLHNGGLAGAQIAARARDVNSRAYFAVTRRALGN